MPTGYTAAIADGITFQQFALQCARAFGALVMMRDEPAGAEIPEEFKPSDFYERMAADARRRLAELRAMSPEQAESEALKVYLDERERRAKSVRDNDGLRAKYESMLANVDSSVPPTDEHAGLKHFMREQIKSSIEFDCSPCRHGELVQQSGAAWLSDAIARAEQDIARYEQEHAAEVERTNKRNAWVRALRESLSQAS